MKQIYTINQYYFDNIDTHNKAYFLGMLWSDGHNNTKSGEIILTQIQGNHHILYELRNEIESNCPIKIRTYSYSKNPRYDLTIYNRYMSNKLESYGMIKNKTHFLQFPLIHEQFYNSFILGIFDGDGCLSKNKNNYNNHMLSFVGNDDLINNIRNIIKHKFDSNGSITIRRSKSPNIITLSYSGNRNVFQIMNWLYSDCKINNIRKLEKFKALSALINSIDDDKYKKSEINILKNLQKIDAQFKLDNLRQLRDSNILVDLLNGYSIRQLTKKYKRNSTYIRNIINLNNINYGNRKRMFAKDPKNI